MTRPVLLLVVTAWLAAVCGDSVPAARAHQDTFKPQEGDRLEPDRDNDGTPDEVMLA